MKYINIILILMLLSTGAIAAEPKISPTWINWTKDINSQIHGITAPSLDADAATKKYVDDNVLSGGLATTGGTMTGQIDFGGFTLYNTTTPVNDSDAATKQYVDINSGEGLTKVNKSGDTMSGPLAMGAQKITGLANGTAVQDAVTYSQLRNESREPYAIVGPYLWADYQTDGTDDAAQVLQAYAAGYRTVYIAGSITLQTLKPISMPGDGYTLRGYGNDWNGRIESGADFHGPQIVMNHTGTIIEYLTLDGNADTNHALSDGIYWDTGGKGAVRNVNIGHFGGNGINIVAVGSLGGSDISNCAIHDVDNGIKTTADNGDLLVYGNEIAVCRGSAINNAGGDNRFLSNHFWQNASVGGWMCQTNASSSGWSRTLWQGNLFDDVQIIGLYIGKAEESTIVADNLFFNANTDNAVFLYSNGDLGSITGNTFSDLPNAHVTNGITLSSDTLNNEVIGNTLKGCVISDSGTTNDAAHNKAA